MERCLANIEYNFELSKEYAQGNFIEDYEFFISNLTNRYGNLEGSLIDICCGTGDIAKMIKSQFSELDVTGCDSSRDMINLANQDPQLVKFILASATNVSQKFDYIICNNAYRHFDDTELFWKAIKKMSHNDTKILISDLIRPIDDASVSNIVNKLLSNNVCLNNLLTTCLKSAYSEDELKKQVPPEYAIEIITTDLVDLKIFNISNIL